MKALLALSLMCCIAAGAGAADERAVTPPDHAGSAPRVLMLLNAPPPHFRADGDYSGGYANPLGSAARRRLAQSLARAHGLALASEWPMPLLGLDCFVMDVPAPQQPQAVADALGRDPRVAWAQPMNLFHPFAHDDPLFGLQPAAREWQLDELHAVATGRGVRVAIVDSGVELDHPDLQGQIAARANLVEGRPYASELHGTAVAGIVAARADNHVGIAGIAPQATLLVLRACWQTDIAETLCDTLSLARALQAAIEQVAHVVNLSLGGPSDRLIRQLIDAALRRGVAVVAAQKRSTTSGAFPAGIDGVVAVTDEAPGRAPAGVLAAPGTDVPTTVPGARWATVSGPSYAAAHVTGLLALMLEVRQQGAGSRRAAPASELVRRPDGRVDACASLERAGTSCACTCGAVPLLESMARH